MDGGVEEQLEERAEDAEEGAGEADLGGGHAEAASEAFGEGPAAVMLFVRRGGSGARGGQEEGQETGEGAEVEVEEGRRHEGEDHVAGPDAAEGELGSRSRLGTRGGGWCVPAELELLRL